MKKYHIALLSLLFLFITITLEVVAWKQSAFHINKKERSVVKLEKSQYHKQPKLLVTAPDLALAPQVRRGIPLEPSPVNKPSAEELREFPGAIVAEASETEGPEPGQKTRLRILKTHFKYPNIRTEEIIDTQNNFVVLRQEMAADHFLVTLAPGEDPQTFFNSLGNQVTSMERVTDNAPLYRVDLAETASLDALPATLQSSTQATAGTGEPDGIVHTSSIPNDSLFSNQWGLYKFLDFRYFGGGRNTIPTYGIDAFDAWNVRTDASSVIVAVIDSGIRYTHEDLAANMWNNRDPKTANNFHGWNAHANNNDPMDDNGHGTMCAGIIGSSGNNGIGACGVAWKVQLMACKFLDSQGAGTLGDEIVCIDYAIDHGAKIINCSFGSYDWNFAGHDSFQRAQKQGVIAVCAAGNDGKNADTDPFYPARYSLDNIVSVAAQAIYPQAEIASADAPDLASFSNYGAHSVDLAAPGESIFSTYGGPIPNPDSGFIGRTGSTPDSAYAYMNGTSAAAPFVTGTLALMTAQFPKKSYNNLIARLLATTDKVPSLQKKLISGGRLNVANALGYVAPPTL
ncbi:MAG: S8 family peptidase [Verrucomicrobiota bacterium]